MSSKTKRVAVVPGSFDPITLGHMEMIRKASELFDEVWVAVSRNAEKNCMFTPEQRLAMVEASVANYPNVHAALCEGLLSDFLHEKNACYLVKGIRNASDADYEMNLAMIMERFDPAFRTVLIPASAEWMAVTSTYVRELIRYRQDVSQAMPEEAIEKMNQR